MGVLSVCLLLIISVSKISTWREGQGDFHYGLAVAFRWSTWTSEDSPRYRRLFRWCYAPHTVQHVVVSFVVVVVLFCVQFLNKEKEVSQLSVVIRFLNKTFKNLGQMSEMRVSKSMKGLFWKE